ncbi:hypothetical protein EON65_58865 [archaeon]|nr:MAG: hypothetical protein EON65_58865 [archaeon]
MPRGICWDDLPDRFYGASKREQSRAASVEWKPVITPEPPAAKETDLVRDMQDVGRRVLFGVVVSSCIPAHN